MEAGPATWLWSRGGTFGGRSPPKIFRAYMQFHKFLMDESIEK